MAQVIAPKDEAVTPARETRTTWASSTFDSFAVPEFRLLWLNSFLMLTAVHLAFTAQNVVAFDITGNNRAVGFVAFATGTAMMVTTPLAGVIADRVPKRLLLCLTEAMFGLMTLAIGLLLAADALNIVFLAGGGFIFGAAISFFWPAQTALMGDLIEERRRANGAALSQVCLNVTRSFAPFAAGGLLAWSLVGSSGTYLIATVLLLPMLITGWMCPERPSTPSSTRMWREVALGLKYVRERRRVLEAVMIFIVVTLLGFSILVILPGFTKETLGGGDAGFGIMFGVNAIGALVASLFAASLGGSRSAPLLVAVTTFLFGVLIAVTGLMPTFALAVISMGFVGAAGGAFQTLAIANMLRASTPEYYGRVMSLTTVAWSLTNLLGLGVGILADAVTERTTLIIVGGAVCAASVLLTLWTRRPEHA